MTLQTFFINKIKMIRDALDHHLAYKPSELTVPKFEKCREMSEDEVLMIIKKMPTKSCDLDAWEASLMKRTFPKMIRAITKLVNLSFTGVLESQWKITLLKPLLKKSDLDIMQKLNYRPVSNLSFSSCLVQKCVLIQFNQHCTGNTLLPDYQSAYRANYSCETALVALVNDILWGMKKQKITAVTAIDLLPAFDTTENNILLEVL